MRDELRKQLEKEVTRQQFLQYMSGALLLIFGLSNLASLLNGTRAIERRIYLPGQGDMSSTGFGTRKFGV